MAKPYSSLEELVRDKNRIAVQIGNTIQTYDATSTSQDSPLAYSNSVITITIPERAVEFIVAPTTDMRISEVAAMGTYDVIEAGSKESIPCARAQYLYIVRDAADGNLRFRFTLI